MVGPRYRVDSIITLNARLDLLAEDDQSVRRSSWTQLHIVPNRPADDPRELVLRFA